MVIMKEFHTCDYKYSNWNDVDEHLRKCIKRNKTIKKIREDLMNKRFQKHREELQKRNQTESN